VPRRTLALAYAALGYTAFLASTVWAIAFLADIDLLTRVDHGAHGSAATAVVVDLALVSLFAAHHSLAARPPLKRLIPHAIERSTYVLAAGLFLMLLLWQWRPIGHSIWSVDATVPRDALWVVYGLGWVLAIASTHMIDHADLTGLRQAAAVGGTYTPPTFAERFMYRWVRHPLMLGLLIAFWATPEMTSGHLLFAASMTVYVVVGVWFEERDLRRSLGAVYEDYAERVPAIVPRSLRGSRA